MLLFFEFFIQCKGGGGTSQLSMFIQSQFGSREQTGENIESGNWRWRLEMRRVIYIDR
jgi:hypothetical protein